MKLADHVEQIRELIEASFDKQFARLGFGKTKQMDDDKVANLPDEIKAKRERFIAMLDNHISETGSYESGREKLLDELTFTLFNRLAAIKVMEAANLFPPVLTKQVEHGDRSLGHKMWLEIYPHMRDEELEGIRDYIKFAFDELGVTLPLYSKAYAYALLPDTISLNDIIDRFNAVEQDEQITKEYVEGIWNSDDVLGWMYESYNNQKKQAHKDSKDKTEYHKVSLQSQVYTPRWVVQFLVENSLGKMYLEMYPSSEIKDNHKIANAPSTRTRDLKPLHEVKIIDPACGSGNFLLYAFDFFYELYIDQIENYGADYEEGDIPTLIIENNLHGIDLDDRAIQLAQLGLFIKAKKKRSSIGEINYNVVSSDFYLPEYDRVRQIFEQGNTLDKNQKELIEKVWSDLQNAYKFGSLVKIDEQIQEQLRAVEERAHDDLFAAADLAEHQSFAETFFKNLSEAVEQYANTSSDTFLTSQTQDAITFLELLTTKYDVATANPPYTDSADFGPDLKKFINNNYKKPYKCHINLYAAFIKRCHELTSDDGKIAMIHPDTFMFIKSFEGVRALILRESFIDIFIHYPQTGGIFGIGLVYPAFYVLDKSRKESELSGFINISNKDGGRKTEKEFLSDRLEHYIQKKESIFCHKINQKKLKEIETYPFVYWISDTYREQFKKNQTKKYFDISEGLKTANNLRYLKFHWEVVGSARDYLSVFKGGPFNRWHGNLWLVIDYDYQLKNLEKEPNSSFSGKKNYTKTGLVCPSVGAKGVSFKINKDSVFSNADIGVYRKNQENTDVYYDLGFFNSKLVKNVMNMLNPTVNVTVGDLSRVPYLVPSEIVRKKVSALSQKCVINKKIINSYKLLEDNYQKLPLYNQKDVSLKEIVKLFLNYENYLNCRILIYENLINEIVFKSFELEPIDRYSILNDEGMDVINYPVFKIAYDYFISEFKEDLDSESLDILQKIEKIDLDYEVVDFCKKELKLLYQNNYSFEDFCFKNKINPINVWYLFKLEDIIPHHRLKEQNLELLIDIVRDVLISDQDGIVPLVPNSGEKILLDLIEEKFYEKGFTSAQYSSFDSVLGRPLNDYINKYFFAELSDHLNLFQYLPKTPFIWHLTSGPEQGFDCYIIIYKWSRDNLMRLRSVYIENRERALQNRQSDLAENESASAQNEKDRIFKQLKEIEVFKGKIDELLQEGYNPLLDDGVGKNIAPLQQKKMLAYDVLNAGQLKKYLNADW